MRTLLIDADVVAYEHAAAGQRTYDFGDGPAKAVDSLDTCLAEARTKIERFVRELKADAVILCFSDPHRNWRKDVLPTYKANRAGTQKPEHLYPLRDALQAEYPVKLVPGLEGDDVMGILATHPKLVPGEKVIVSVDKDMKQIPGLLYNPRTGKKSRITAEQGTLFHYTQMLTGDPVDGYKGLPRCGPVTAAKLLAFPGDVPMSREFAMWDAVRTAYFDAGYTVEDALVQARVSRICQYTDYDFKRKEPILWNPPA